MIKQINCNYTFTRAELKEFTVIRPWLGSNWDKPPNDAIKRLKVKIRSQLEIDQLFCCYCGLKLRGTSKGQIEHIAPKAKFRHPQFTFTLKNLAIACNWCNHPEKKGTKDTIKTIHKIYSKCEFYLVHPYFDNPDEHYSWTDNNIEILIQVKNNSEKAKFSIKMFRLDTLEMNEHRAQQIRYEEIKEKTPITVKDEILIENVIAYKE